MSTTPPSERPGPSSGPGVGAPLSAELARGRRVRWLLVGLAALVLLVALWAFGVRPAGVDLPVLLLGGLLLISTLYALEVSVTEWRSRRMQRLAAVQEQRRRHLAEEVERLDRVDVAARHLADANTLTEAAQRLRSAAQHLVPAPHAAVLLRAGDDLLVSVDGAVDGAVDGGVVGADRDPGIGDGTVDLASRALARGAALRWSRGHGGDDRSSTQRLVVPLRSSAEVVGVLALERGAGSSAFSHAEQRALERLAPHGGRALARTLSDGDHAAASRSVPDTPVADEDAAPQLEIVDLAVLVPAIVDGPNGADGAPVRRVVVLAPTPARIRTDPVAVTSALEELLRRVDQHAPVQAAIAVEVLTCEQQAEIVIAHGGGVLTDDLLDEPRPEAPDVPAPRPAISALGGTVSVRDRSGVPQVRVRLPEAGRVNGEVEGLREVPIMARDTPAGSGT